MKKESGEIKKAARNTINVSIINLIAPIREQNK